MNDSAVLNVDPVSDGDPCNIATNNGLKPNGAGVPHHDVAHERRVWSDPARGVKRGRMTLAIEN